MILSGKFSHSATTSKPRTPHLGPTPTRGPLAHPNQCDYQIQYLYWTEYIVPPQGSKRHARLELSHTTQSRLNRTRAVGAQVRKKCASESLVSSFLETWSLPFSTAITTRFISFTRYIRGTAGLPCSSPRTLRFQLSHLVTSVHGATMIHSREN